MNELTVFQSRALIEIRQHGKLEPITSRKLAEVIGLNGTERKAGANMRSIISALRKKSYPICANGSGYFYPDNNAELMEFINSFEARIEEQTKALDGLKAISGVKNIYRKDPDIRLRVLMNKIPANFQNSTLLIDMTQALASKDAYVKNSAIKKAENYLNNL